MVGELGSFGLRLPGKDGPVELSYEVLDAAPVAMAITDAAGACIWLNAVLCDLLGRGRHELLGSSLDEAVPEEDRATVRSAAARAAAAVAGHVELEHRLRTSDGSTRWVLQRASRAASPAGVSLVSEGSAGPLLVRQLLDVTDRREASAELEAARDELARRNAELERSNAELEEFAQIIAHDLSEPLRVIAGHVELLARRYGTDLDEQATRWIDFAVEGCVRMRRLIEDLLRYAQAGRGELATTTVDLGRLAATVLEDLAPAIASSGAEVHLEPLPVVEADPSLLAQVLRNLVVNACKFAAPDGSGRIEVAASPEGEGWRVEVVDDGEGVPEAHRERIFAPFRRLHDRTVPGTGIGLAICRKAVERHGGRIWVEEAPGGGAAFCFTLPAGSRPS